MACSAGTGRPSGERGHQGDPFAGVVAADLASAMLGAAGGEGRSVSARARRTPRRPEGAGDRPRHRGHSIDDRLPGRAVLAPAWLGAIFTRRSPPRTSRSSCSWRASLPGARPDARWVGPAGRCGCMIPFAAWTVLVWLLGPSASQGVGWIRAGRSCSRTTTTCGSCTCCSSSASSTRCSAGAVLAAPRRARAACLLVEPRLGRRDRARGLAVPGLRVGPPAVRAQRFEPGPVGDRRGGGAARGDVDRSRGANPMYAVPAWAVSLSRALGTLGWVVRPRDGRSCALLRGGAAGLARRELRSGSCARCATALGSARSRWACTRSHQFFFPRFLIGTGQVLDVLTRVRGRRRRRRRARLCCWSGGRRRRSCSSASGRLPDWVRRDSREGIRVAGT